MHKLNSKEIARVDNSVGGRLFIQILRLALNTARYKLKIRGRKPDKRQMKADHLSPNHYSRNGDIPRIHATELAIYLNGVHHECDTCAVIKENMGLRDRLTEVRSKLVELEKRNTKLEEELKIADIRVSIRDQHIEHIKKIVYSLRDEINNRDATIDGLKRGWNRTKKRAEYWAMRWKKSDKVIIAQYDFIGALHKVMDNKDRFIAMTYYFGDHE